MSGDVTLDATLKITSGTVNLCLNGYDIAASEKKAIEIAEGVTLNICDCTDNGSITSNNGNYGTIGNNGTVNVYSAKVTGTGYSYGIVNDGTVSVYDGEVTSTSSAISSYKGTITISGSDADIYLGGFSFDPSTVAIGGVLETTKPLNIIAKIQISSHIAILMIFQNTQSALCSGLAVWVLLKEELKVRLIRRKM